MTSLASPSMRWVGAGRPAFLGDAGRGADRRPTFVRTWAEFQERFGAGEIGSPPFRRSVESYFRCGGKGCYVVHLESIDTLPDGRAAALLLGEDGGPGYRSGLHALGDFDDVGTIACPGLANPPCRNALLEYARRRPSKTLVLEGFEDADRQRELLRTLLSTTEWQGASGGAPLVDRVVWLAGEPDTDDGWPRAPSGPALGALETVDFDPERPALSAERPELSLATLGETFESLRVWRRWEGLRRSIDLGTRWVLFEVAEDRLLARVEREIRGFLRQLLELRFLAPLSEEEEFTLACRALPTKIGRDRAASLVIRVRARLVIPGPTKGASGETGEARQAGHRVFELDGAAGDRDW